MKIGFVRYSPRFGLVAQRAAIQAAGVREAKIYQDGKGESREDLIKTLRRGDVIVVDGLHRFGVNRADLTAALQACEGKGVTVMDATTGRTTTAEAAALLSEAWHVLAGEARRPSPSAIRRSSEKRKGRRKARALENEELEAIWTDMTIPTNDEAAEKAGVPKRSLYRLFGSSGRPAGWPGKRANH